MMPSLISLELLEVFVNSCLWFNNVSLVFGVDGSMMIVLSVLLHKISDNDRQTFGHVHLAVNEDVVFRQHGFNVGMSIIKMRIDVGFVIAFQINPFAEFDFGSSKFVLDSEAVICHFVNNTQNT